MKKQVKDRKVSILGAITTFIMMTFMSTSSQAADVANGNGCVAANLNQAFELVWNHARVENPASNPFARFVTCTLSTGQKWTVNAMGDPITTLVESGGVTAHFLSGAAVDSEVSCVFREMGNRSTALAATDSSTVTLDAPATIPGYVSASFSAGDGLDMGSFLVLSGSASTIRTLTVTCRLDPGTAISTVHATQSLPAP